MGTIKEKASEKKVHFKRGVVAIYQPALGFYGIKRKIGFSMIDVLTTHRRTTSKIKGDATLF